MAILNITYNGLSADYPVEIDRQLTDADIRRIAVEVVRAGNVPGLQITNLPDNAFALYVVDHLNERIYLRPKVPFGA